MEGIKLQTFHYQLEIREEGATVSGMHCNAFDKLIYDTAFALLRKDESLLIFFHRRRGNETNVKH